jgi:hypothetical protein
MPCSPQKNLASDVLPPDKPLADEGIGGLVN